MTILDDARAGMNPDIRPQDDLFGHVNGRWLDETEIPSDRSSWGPFVQLADTAEEQVRADHRGPRRGATPDQLSEDARKIGDLYASFMDEDRINKQGLRPVRPLIDAVDGLRDVRDLAAFLGEFERLGGHGLFGSYVDTDDRNSDRYLFHVVQGGLGLPDESYYRDDKFAEVREKYVAYLDGAARPGRARRPGGRRANTILEIDTQLAKGHWERAETRDVQKTYNLTTAEELKALCPSFDWDAYVTNLGGDADTVAETLRPAAVVPRAPLDACSTRCRSRTGSSGCSSTSCAPRRRTSPTTSSPSTSTSTAAPSTARRSCAPAGSAGSRWSRAAIGEAVGKEYVARHFPPESKAQMDELVANLLEAYRQSIAALDWMSEETKQRAYEKLETFRPKIGYPEKFRDYSALEVRADDLLGNVAAASSFETDRQLRKIGSPVDRDEWFMLPQTVNAYYNPGTNEICFPAGDPAEAVLQPRRRRGRELRRRSAP